MAWLRIPAAVGLVALASVASPIAAQESQSSALTGAEVRSLVDDHASTVVEQRAALQAFLDRSEVQEVARDAGIDIRDVKSAASTLSASELAALLPHYRSADEALAGGDTIVISTTAIIIGLLILIIILVA